MIKGIIKLLILLHNFSYKWISSLSVRAEGGIHPKHRLIGYHDFFLNCISKDDTVLDIGCGNGSLAFDLSQKAHKVIGIDIDPNTIKKAKARYRSANLEFILGDATQYTFNNKFDVIVLSNVLEHIKNRVQFLKKIKTIAPKKLIRVPMENRDWITLYKKELKMEYRLDPTHEAEYTLKLFRKELKDAGYVIMSHEIIFGELWAIVE